MSSQSLAERVLFGIRSVVDPDADFVDGALRISRWEGGPVTPLFVHLSPDELAERMTVDEETRAELWPSRTTEEAGLFLFLHHLGELVQRRTRRPGHDHVVQQPDGQLVLSSAPAASADAPSATPRGAGPGQWYAHTPLSDARWPVSGDDQSTS